MTTQEQSVSYSRRRFFLAGGASLVGAATLSACAGSSVVNTSGTTPTTDVAATAPPTTATEAEVTAGLALAQTITSLEHSLAAFYDKFNAAAYLDEDARTWGVQFAAHHSANATALEQATVAAGGDAYSKPNEYVDTQLIESALKVADQTKSSEALVRLANQLEATGAATGTLAIATIPDVALRASVMAVAATNARQAYVWELVIEPEELVDALPDALYPLRDALPAQASVVKAADD